MTCQLRAPGPLSGRSSGRYRGFEVSARRDSGLSDIDRCFVEVVLPTAMPRMTVRYEQWGEYGPSSTIEGGVAVGYPPFDRLFGVYGDHRFIRAAITPEFVGWIMAIDWPTVKTRLLFQNTIVFGETRFGGMSIAAELDTGVMPHQIQSMLDLLIDFLYLLSTDIWPIPLPSRAARA